MLTCQHAYMITTYLSADHIVVSILPDSASSVAYRLRASRSCRRNLRLCPQGLSAGHYPSRQIFHRHFGNRRAAGRVLRKGGEYAYIIALDLSALPSRLTGSSRRRTPHLSFRFALAITA